MVGHSHAGPPIERQISGAGLASARGRLMTANHTTLKALLDDLDRIMSYFADDCVRPDRSTPPNARAWCNGPTETPDPFHVRAVGR